VTYTITVDIPVGFAGSLVSQTIVTSDTPDPFPTCAECIDTDTPPVAPEADLVVTKTLNSGTTYTAGMDAVYTITVTNNGPIAAQNVVVSDMVPAGFDPATVAWYGTNGSNGTGNLSDTIATLEDGETVTYTF